MGGDEVRSETWVEEQVVFRGVCEFKGGERGGSGLVIDQVHGCVGFAWVAEGGGGGGGGVCMIGLPMLAVGRGVGEGDGIQR